ncbi:MAG TPA: hypothetical protein VGI70_05655, partial [Polyangiales bacterium]
LLDADVVRAVASDSALTLLSEDGSLLRLSPQTGADLSRSRLTAGHVVSADLSPLTAAAAHSVPAARPLRDTLIEIVLDTDARLLPARLLALNALAAIPDGSITQDLLRIDTQPGIPAPLRSRITALLPARKLGSEYLVDALLDRYDYLEDRSPPPLAAIVPALVAAHETRAVPRLVERLFDPATPLDELRLLVEAIASLGDTAAAQPLARFLAMYHADSSLADDPSSLTAAARALHQRGGRSDEEMLQGFSHDTATLPALRASLAELPQPMAAEPPPPTAAEPAAAASAETNVPERLSDDAIARALATKAEELRTCTLEELTRNPDLRSVRLSFIVKGDGSFDALSVLPDHPAFSQCLQARLSSLRFPPFRSGRRLASYNVAVHPNMELALTPPSAAGERPFWRNSELRAGAAAQIPDTPPWWRDQNPLFVAVDEAPKPANNAAKAVVSEPAVTPKEPATTQKSIRPAESKPVESAPDDAWWLPVQKQK